MSRRSGELQDDHKEEEDERRQTDWISHNSRHHRPSRHAHSATGEQQVRHEQHGDHQKDRRQYIAGHACTFSDRPESWMSAR
jgi:hypothetical protein